MFDGKAFGDQVVEMVRDYVERTLAPIVAENAALRAKAEKGEQRPVGVAEDRVAEMIAAAMPETTERPQPLSVDEVGVMINEAVARAVQALPTPEAGKDADPEVVRGMVEAAVAGLPVPKDGQSVTADDLEAIIAEHVAKAVAALPVPQPGKDADPDLIRSMVEAAVAALPPPKDGTSVTANEVDPLIAAHVSKAIAALPTPKNGVGLAGALINRDGSLILTLSDGTLVDLGRVEGRDGNPGMGPEDVNVTLMDDARTVRLAFTKGDTEYAFQIPFPVVIDRGVFKDGETYERGDAVTWAGSLWIAQEPTAEKPDASKGWRLAVKRGRDGKAVPRG